MQLILWTLFGLMAACGFIGWCCVRAGAKSDKALSEEELDYACECALSTELSDHSFVRAGK
jgi:hypothetical protein